MTNEEKQQLLSSFISRGGEHPEVFDTGRMLDHIEAQLREQGVDDEMLATMRIIATARSEWRRTVAGVARNLIFVESLPKGAQPIYSRDPDVALLTTDD